MEIIFITPQSFQNMMGLHKQDNEKSSDGKQ